MSENVKLDTAQSNTADEIDLLDILIALAHHKKWIAGCTIGLGGAALVASLLMTPIFTSTAKIMPPQQQSSNVSAMLGQLGALAGAAGNIAGLKNPNDLYVGMLQSQTIADNLIKRFKLMEHYESKSIVDTRNALSNASDITAGKDGLISISIDDSDPQFAAKLANAYIDELINLTQSLAITDAAQKRVFYEKQLKQAKEQLADAEIALKQTQEKTGLLKLDDQVKSIIENVAQVRAAISSKEVQLSSMKTYATASNPDYLRVKQEINALKIQLTQLEQKKNEKDTPIVPVEKIPETGLEYVRKLRDVNYYETMFTLLAKVYEQAKIEEANDSPTIQILDKATTPDKKSKPRRTLVTLSGIIVGFIIGIMASLFKSILNGQLINEKRSEKKLSELLYTIKKTK